MSELRVTAPACCTPTPMLLVQGEEAIAMSDAESSPLACHSHVRVCTCGLLALVPFRDTPFVFIVDQCVAHKVHDCDVRTDSGRPPAPALPSRHYC